MRDSCRRGYKRRLYREFQRFPTDEPALDGRCGHITTLSMMLKKFRKGGHILNRVNAKRLVFLLAAVLSAANHVCGREISPEARKARGAELRKLLRFAKGANEKPARTSRTPKGYVRFLSAPPETRFSAVTGKPEEQAEKFLKRWRNRPQLVACAGEGYTQTH